MITMKTNLSDLNLDFKKAISDLQNKDEARDLDGAVYGSLFWKRGKLNKETGVKKEISKLKKVKRLVAKKIRSIPDKQDRYGNTMISSHAFNMESFISLARNLGANKMDWNNGYTAVYSGDNIALTYCEGSVITYCGTNIRSTVNDSVRFWSDEF